MGTKFEAPETGGSFIGKEEKRELIAAGTPLPVVRVSRVPDSFNPGRERHLLVVELDGEERTLGFGIGDKGSSRADLLEALIRHFQLDDPEPVTLKMVEGKGNFILLEVVE